MSTIGNIFYTDKKTFSYYGILTVDGKKIPVLAYPTRTKQRSYLTLTVTTLEEIEALDAGIHVEQSVPEITKPEITEAVSPLDVQEIQLEPIPFDNLSGERPVKEKPNKDQLTLF